MKQILLSLLLAFTLLLVLKLPILADPPSSFSFSESVYENNVGLMDSSLAITFTPVATLYLPIVVVPPPAPVISNISYSLLLRDDPACDSGDSYRISFNYTDRNGDAEFGYIDTVAVFSPGGQTFEVPFPTIIDGNSDGFKGKAYLYPCLEFSGPDKQVTITVRLVDGGSLKSNPLVVTIPKT